MNLFTKFLLKVGGDETNFELEHRIFNISSFLITAFGVIGSVGNYLTGLPLMTVWLSIAGFLISGSLFYLSRVKQIFNSKIIFAFLIAVVSVLGLMFFYNGGTQGTLLYLIIMFLTIFLLIVPTSYQNITAIVLFLTLILLITLEFLFPNWIIPYHSRDEMLTDHIMVMFYTVFFTSIIIVVFRKKYLEDRNQMLFQKNELEEKTRQLELTVEKAHERNRHIEMLMKELNHRVKNNLQLVSSLLLKQANSSTDKSAKSALLDTKNRLLSLILLHQRLYGHENATRIFIPNYLKELAESILVSFNNFEDESIIYDTDEVWLNVESAISVGLIANELITNSFKHGFSDVSEPKLFVTFKKQGTNFTLSIADNGPGMEENGEVSGFGMELIELLTKQLKGKLVKDCKTNKGCCFSITFSDLHS